MSETVHTDIDNRVCTLTIDNESKRNALSPKILSELIDEINHLNNNDDVRVLVLTGAGSKAFSSGYDISELGDNGKNERSGLFEQMITCVREFSLPTVAMINGHVFGGAMELIAACDIRIAVNNALFGIPPAKLGLIYSDRGINGVMKLIGPAYTKELLFTGEPIDAKRANEIGLLNHIVDRPHLEEKVDEITSPIANNAPLSLIGMKQVVHALLDKRSLTDTEKRWVEQLRIEAEESEDHAEGLNAFAAKREPNFEGR